MVTRNEYGIPVMSGPMMLHTSHNDATPEQKAEAAYEAEAEARLFLAQEDDDMGEMYNFV